MSMPAINQVYHGDALRLLRGMPPSTIDVVLADPMYGVASMPGPRTTYDWGVDPAQGDPDKWWAYHRPIYEECRRVLKPNGTLAWAMGAKFRDRFAQWFHGHRIWSLTRYFRSGRHAYGHVWIVQTQSQTPIPFPDRDSLLVLHTPPALLRLHPCPKAVGEMAFMVEQLSRPGDLILDCFAGIGTTLVAAQQLGRRWLGCDLSLNYCRVALRRLRRDQTAS